MSWASTRFSMVSGGLACIAGVVAACAALPQFRRYRAENTEIPADALEAGYRRDDLVASTEGNPA